MEKIYYGKNQFEDGELERIEWSFSSHSIVEDRVLNFLRGISGHSILVY